MTRGGVVLPIMCSGVLTVRVAHPLGFSSSPVCALRPLPRSSGEKPTLYYSISPLERIDSMGWWLKDRASGRPKPFLRGVELAPATALARRE